MTHDARPPPSRTFRSFPEQIILDPRAAIKSSIVIVKFFIFLDSLFLFLKLLLSNFFFINTDATYLRESRRVSYRAARRLRRVVVRLARLRDALEKNEYKNKIEYK